MGRGGGGGGGRGFGGGRGSGRGTAGHGGGSWGRGGGRRGGGVGGGIRGQGRGSGRVPGSGSKNGNMKRVGRQVPGMKNSGNRGITREHRKDSANLINRFNDIRSKFGNIKGPNGQPRNSRYGRSKGGRGGGGADASDLLMQGIDEICARIADAAINAAISTAYGMCGNEGQLAIIDGGIGDIEGCWEAIFEGSGAEVSFAHPEAVGQIEDAVNEILEQAADQCADVRALADDFSFSLEDNDGKGDYDFDWYGYDG